MQATTPPNSAVPAMLAWRKTSPQRSTPGPLPYQRPKTPSTRPSPCRPTCWEPQSAVAARSSFRPGSNLMSAAVSCLRAFIMDRSTPAERRAAIAGRVARGGQPRRLVARLLHQEHAHQRLDAAEQHGALGEVEAVRQRDVVEGHATSRGTMPARYRSEGLTNQAKFLERAEAARTTENVTGDCPKALAAAFRPACGEIYGIAAGSAYIGGAETTDIRRRGWTGTSCESSMRWPTRAA